MKDEYIVVKGARENNLKNIDVSIPRDKLVVLTGLSGSGKSSLAFETIYAEGQRRYIESLSSYARLFLGQMEKPDVDSIEGLSPAISIDQKTTSKNPRSTVGTVTEIYDYLRLLFARIAQPFCPKCGREISAQSIDQMVNTVLELPAGTRFQILAPVVRGRKGEYSKLIESLYKSGYSRIRCDGLTYDLTEKIELEKNKTHYIEVIVDRLTVREGIETRLADSLETALKLSSGLALISSGSSSGNHTVFDDILMSQNYSCPECGISIPDATPRLFSFNNPLGACPKCTGIGYTKQFRSDYFGVRTGKQTFNSMYGIVEKNLKNYYIPDYSNVLKALEDEYDFDGDAPLSSYNPRATDLFVNGNINSPVKYKSGGVTKEIKFPGYMELFKQGYEESQQDRGFFYYTFPYESYMIDTECDECKGKRLKNDALSFKINNKNIADITAMSVPEAKQFFAELSLTGEKALIAMPILKEIQGRLSFLVNVGLDYLTLDRVSATLSGGESQRIRLATQIGAGLMGVVYILDEPSIGLHQRDNQKLLNTLKQLRDLGNTLIVVEHDEETMMEADYIVDIGPGAGIHGGNLICAGTPEEIMACEGSITGKYLSGKEFIPVPERRVDVDKGYIRLKGASANNLKEIDVDFPLGKFICVTGVSGSGKSSLVNQVLCNGIRTDLLKDENDINPDKNYKEIQINGEIDKLIIIDQSPIGRTPRSNPVTYVGAFTAIRDIFAKTAESRARGYKSGRFSFNVKGGRCESCAGDGIKKIEMHFLPDIYVPCEVCKGKRFNRETLEVTYKGKNISEVLEMTIEDGEEFFSEIPLIKRKLQTLNDVGLGYMKIGQQSTTLSGGEAQRVKLADELGKVSTGKTLYILDEPTTGLHTADVKKLIEILQKLTASQNTVIVIEHNLDIIKNADYIIDLGPEGGNRGGQVIATGTPEEVAECPGSYTGQWLKKILNKTKKG